MSSENASTNSQELNKAAVASQELAQGLDQRENASQPLD